jgi:arthrofactin-type cyclic lipopeptide synthetase B
MRPDQRVAICVERGPQMLVGLLGILKAGAGYVPIDPAYPLERIAYTLQDSAPVAVLTQADTLDRVGAQVPSIDLDSVQLQAELGSNPQIPGLSESSGLRDLHLGLHRLPKGVMVEHRNVVRLFSATHDWFNFNPQDVWARSIPSPSISRCGKSGARWRLAASCCWPQAVEPLAGRLLRAAVPQWRHACSIKRRAPSAS